MPHIFDGHNLLFAALTMFYLSVLAYISYFLLVRMLCDAIFVQCNLSVQISTGHMV